MECWRGGMQLVSSGGRDPKTCLSLQPSVDLDLLTSWLTISLSRYQPVAFHEPTIWPILKHLFILTSMQPIRETV